MKGSVVQLAIHLLLTDWTSVLVQVFAASINATIKSSHSFAKENATG